MAAKGSRTNEQVAERNRLAVLYPNDTNVQLDARVDAGERAPDSSPDSSPSDIAPTAGTKTGVSATIDPLYFENFLKTLISQLQGAVQRDYYPPSEPVLDENRLPVQATGPNGELLWKTDAKGNPIFDAEKNKQPIYKRTLIETMVPRTDEEKMAAWTLRQAAFPSAPKAPGPNATPQEIERYNEENNIYEIYKKQDEQKKLADEQLRNMYGNLFESNALNKAQESINPLIQSLSLPLGENIKQYMSPYKEQVLDTIEERGKRALQEKLLPSINSAFVGRGGAFGSRHKEFVNRAIRDTSQAIADAQAEAGHRGYETAANIAGNDSLRRLQGAGLISDLARKGVESKLAVAQGYSDLNQAMFNDKYRQAAALAASLAPEREEKQQLLNQRLNEFQRQQNLPYENVALASGALSGMRPGGTGTAYFGTTAPTQYPGSMTSLFNAGLQVGGPLATGTGPANWGALFGASPRTYATGGRVNALANVADRLNKFRTSQDQEREAYANALIQNRLNTQHPMARSLATIGHGIMQNPTEPLLSAWSRSLAPAQQAYQEAQQEQMHDAERGYAIKEAIENSLKAQAAAEAAGEAAQRKEEREERRLDMQEARDNARLGLERDRFDLDKERLGSQSSSVKLPASAIKANFDRQNKIRSMGESGQAMLGSIAEMRDLLQSKGLVTGTGAESLLAVQGLVNTLSSSLMGIPVFEETVKNGQVFNKISKEFTLDNIKKLGVRIPVAEMKMIEQSIPSLGISPEANLKVLEIFEKIAQRAVLERNFMLETVDPETGLLPVNYDRLLEEKYPLSGEVTATEKITPQGESVNVSESGRQYPPGTFEPRESSGRIIVMNPQTGEELSIEETDLDSAIAEGWNLKQ